MCRDDNNLGEIYGLEEHQLAVVELIGVYYLLNHLIPTKREKPGCTKGDECSC